MALRSMPSEEVAMEHQFFIRQQNLQLYRSLVAASEAVAAKADARQQSRLLKPLDQRLLGCHCDRIWAPLLKPIGQAFQ